VFEEFIRSITTYRPLLLQIKAAYEPVLRDALCSYYDYVHLFGELATAPAQLAAAVEAARVAAGHEAAGMVVELEEKLATAEQQAAEVGAPWWLHKCCVA